MILRVGKWIITAAIAMYIVVGGYVYLNQENIIFNFAPVSEGHQYRFYTETEDVWLSGKDGAVLHGAVFKTISARKGVVIYYKGNAGNLQSSEKMARTFTGLGYDVVSMDYRGFGKSRGDISEEHFLNDAEVWFDWAKKRFAGDDIRIVGYSLGTTAASHIAAVKDVDDVILFAPMKSVLHIAQLRYPFLPTFVSKFPLRSDLKLAQAEAEVVVYHGTADRIVPYESGEALVNALNGKADLVTVPEAGHLDLPWLDPVLIDIATRWAD